MAKDFKQPAASGQIKPPPPPPPPPPPSPVSVVPPVVASEPADQVVNNDVNMIVSSQADNAADVLTTDGNSEDVIAAAASFTSMLGSAPVVVYDPDKPTQFLGTRVPEYLEDELNDLAHLHKISKQALIIQLLVGALPSDRLRAARDRQIRRHG